MTGVIDRPANERLVVFQVPIEGEDVLAGPATVLSNRTGVPVIIPYRSDQRVSVLILENQEVLMKRVHRKYVRRGQNLMLSGGDRGR